MQTFLPYGEQHDANARALDYKRLGKQRVEGYQLLNANNVRSRGWRNHPAARMWYKYDTALVAYTLDMCERWTELGYKDSIADKLAREYRGEVRLVLQGKWIDPWWIDHPIIHDIVLSHRSNLVRKLPEHYGPLWPDVPNDLPYVWPGPIPPKE